MPGGSVRRELLCLVYAFVVRPLGQAGYYVLDLSVPSSVRPSVRHQTCENNIWERVGELILTQIGTSG